MIEDSILDHVINEVLTKFIFCTVSHYFILQLHIVKSVIVFTFFHSVTYIPSLWEQCLNMEIFGRVTIFPILSIEDLLMLLMGT